MIAAWQVRPPRFVTIAAARFITGSQSGSVMSATSTSPGLTRSISAADLTSAHAALADLLPDRAAAREHRGVRLQPVAAQVLAALARLHGLRPRLQDVELAVDAVAAPLDVHRAAVVLLDGHGEARELLDFGVGDREAVPVGVGHLDGGGRLAGGLRVGEHHPDRLGAERLAQDRRPARGEIGLVDVELVRIHRALDDGFAEAVRRR